MLKTLTHTHTRRKREKEMHIKIVRIKTGRKISACLARYRQTMFTKQCVDRLLPLSSSFSAGRRSMRYRYHHVGHCRSTRVALCWYSLRCSRLAHPQPAGRRSNAPRYDAFMRPRLQIRNDTALPPPAPIFLPSPRRSAGFYVR